MPVQAQIQEILDFIESRGVPPHYELPVEEARVNMAKARAVFCGDPVALPRVEDRRIPGPGGEIPVRLYAASGDKALPMLVYYHGGGWVLGSIDTHDDLCRRLARETGCLVINVDYRLAPEHRFPAAVDDAYAAVEWAAAHAAEIGGDPARIAVGGDSAGGNLSAVVSQLARDRGGPQISHQMLVYPATTQGDYETPSMKANGEGYFLTVQGMKWFWDLYLSDPGQSQSPLVSPMRAESLAGLPPAFVLTAEYDPLRDEGEAYAKRLAEAGVPVEQHRFDGVIHGFFTMTVTDPANEAIRTAAAALRRDLGL